LLDIWVLNVGHGDSLVIRCETPDGRSAFAVVDSNGTLGKEPAALVKLRQLGATELSFVMLTHPHADHYQGLASILSAYSGRVRHFYTFPLGDFITKKAEKLKALLERMIDATEGSHRASLLELYAVIGHARRETREHTMEWEEPAGRWNKVFPPGFESLTLMEILLPLPKCKGSFFQLLDKQDPKALVSDLPNDLSIAMRISVENTVLLLGADATWRSWYDHRAQTVRYKDRPDADLVKIPHHGSKHDVTPEMVTYWYKQKSDGAQRFGVVSADGRRHPHVEALNALEAAGIHPYCTNLARPCGGGKIDAMFTSADVPLNVSRIINAGDVELPVGAIQPCQGEIHIHVAADGQLTVTPEFHHPCGFRGDYAALGLT
jgi:beta-lactamase superfamily II metal-dependent hydrolase